MSMNFPNFSLANEGSDAPNPPVMPSAKRMNFYRII